MQQQLSGDSTGGNDNKGSLASVPAQIHHWITDTYFSGELNTNPHVETLLLYGGTFIVGGLVAVALSFGLNLFSFVVARVMLFTSAALLVVGLTLWVVHATCLSLGYLARIERKLFA